MASSDLGTAAPEEEATVLSGSAELNTVSRESPDECDSMPTSPQAKSSSKLTISQREPRSTVNDPAIGIRKSKQFTNGLNDSSNRVFRVMQTDNERSHIQVVHHSVNMWTTQVLEVNPRDIHRIVDMMVARAIQLVV